MPPALLLRLAVVLLCATCASLVWSQEPDGFTPPPIEVLDGFEVTLAAAPPLVSYPMMACFDDRGRLYVAESDGRNLTTKGEILKELPRFVRRLVDIDGDGVFDESTIFADRMTMPEGGLWHGGALYIISAPYLWRLEDVDDDGVADTREKILGYMEFDGRANQHGPYLGPNGRFYFTGGHFGFDFVGSDGSRTGKSRSAGVFSCWPDGSEVRVEGQGPINPVDVVFTANGELLSTCAIFDSFGGRHDALIHWIRGALTQRIYGVPVLPETGYRLPAMTRWGQVAPAGLVRYRGKQFGDAYENTLFACQFNTQKLVHVRLQPNGATFTTEDRDFLSSSNIDFHPADVLEDADGSLLLLDTGGWLSWGCPHSKLAKPEVQGAIYRIRKSGAAKEVFARGPDLDWELVDAQGLAARLGDDRPAVRDQARERLVERGELAVSAVLALLRKATSPVIRKRCLWVLSRIGSEASRTAIRGGLSDGDAGVRQVAVRSAGKIRKPVGITDLLPLLADHSAPVRRATATALGEIGDPAAVTPLFHALQPDSELYFQHAATYALIEIGAFAETAAYLEEHTHPHWQKTALRVLEQTGSEELVPSMVVPLLTSTDLAVRDEARQVVSNRPQWRDEVLQVFSNLLADSEPTSDSTQLVESIVLSLASDEIFQDAIRDGFARSTTTDTMKATLLASIGFMDALPEAFHGTLGIALASGADVIRGEALAVLQRFKPPEELVEHLRNLANRSEQSREVRAGAIAALMQNDLKVGDDAFDFLIDLVSDPETSPLLKVQASRSLGSQQPSLLTPERVRKICDLFAAASPLEIPNLLPAILKFSVLRGGESEPPPFTPDERKAVPVQLGNALKKRTDGAGSLEPIQVAEILGAFPPSITAPDIDLSAILNSDPVTSGDQVAKLVSLLAELPPGNGSRGRVLFQTNRATCALCHRIQGQGGTLGPDLSKIGIIRNRSDLLEAIVFPSVTVVNGYENYVIETKDGESHAGLIQRETPDAVYLRSADQREQRVPREKIASMLRSPVSAMPQGLDQLFSKQELADIVAFLEGCQ